MLASNDEIKKYISSVYPNIDLERVYISDMKKMLKWYEILKASNLLNFEVANEEVASENETAPAEAAVVAEKPAKKARAKKAVTEGEEAAEKPVKKTAAKKKKED